MSPMLVKRSNVGYEETTRALLGAIERRGLKVFAEIDHAAAAREVGLDLESELVVLFGNPRGGTPLMGDDRRIGIELSLRMLVWQEGAAVQLGYLDPRRLGEAYAVAAHASTLEQMAGLLDQLACEAAS
jgi:uncharacterized protein (DUF302 family)